MNKKRELSSLSDIMHQTFETDTKSENTKNAEVIAINFIRRNNDHQSCLTANSTDWKTIKCRLSRCSIILQNASACAKLGTVKKPNSHGRHFTFLCFTFISIVNPRRRSLSMSVFNDSKSSLKNQVPSIIKGKNACFVPPYLV